MADTNCVSQAALISLGQELQRCEGETADFGCLDHFSARSMSHLVGGTRRPVLPRHPRAHPRRRALNWLGLTRLAEGKLSKPTRTLFCETQFDGPCQAERGSRRAIYLSKLCFARIERTFLHYGRLSTFLVGNRIPLIGSSRPLEPMNADERP